MPRPCKNKGSGTNIQWRQQDSNLRPSTRQDVYKRQVLLHTKNCHFVVNSFHLEFHRVKGGELARLVRALCVNAELIFPVRAIKSASATVLRRSGLAVVKMIRAWPCLHELFKAWSLPDVKYIGGRLLSGFGCQKSGVLISPKGKRERRCLRCRIRFSMCAVWDSGLHGKRRRVKAPSECSKWVVNSVPLSLDLPVFPSFFETIRVVIVNYTSYNMPFLNLSVHFLPYI